MLGIEAPRWHLGETKRRPLWLKLRKLRWKKLRRQMYQFKYVKPKKGYKGTYLQNRNRVTDVENILRVTGQRGKGDKFRDWDWHIHTTIYKVTNTDLLYSRGTLLNALYWLIWENNLKESRYVDMSKKNLTATDLELSNLNWTPVLIGIVRLLKLIRSLELPLWSIHF